MGSFKVSNNTFKLRYFLNKRAEPVAFIKKYVYSDAAYETNTKYTTKCDENKLVAYEYWYTVNSATHLIALTARR